MAEITASHTDVQLGGPDKSVQSDETYLTKRKYHRGRITSQMSVIVFGLYCKEDKVGLFFRVNSKSKAELWPYVKKYVNDRTTRICTDSAKQYKGIEKLFQPGAIQLETNHSIGEYVQRGNPLNTINDLENQNRILKDNLICRRSLNHIEQYMALHFYRKYYLEKDYKQHLGSQIMQFLIDMKTVYPGFVDGKLRSPLQLKEIDPPTVDSEGLTNHISAKKARLSTCDDVSSSEVDSDWIDCSDPDDPDYEEGFDNYSSIRLAV